MNLFTFKGGIHPPEEKLSAAAKTEYLPIPEEVSIPLLQHIGAPCNAIVQKGDRVKTGQLIGESGGFVSAPVHASVTGEVTAVEPRPHPIGKEVPAVVIKTEAEDTWDMEANNERNTDNLSAEQLKEIIQKAGIVGMGGAAFPSHVKLSPPPGKKIDTLIINGAECEPYLTADHRLMLERTDDIISGVRFLMCVLNVNRAYIAVEQNKPDAIDALTAAAEKDKKITCCTLKTKYPQGGEKQLINAVTGREVPSGGLPMDCGCVVHNIGTVIAVQDAVSMSRPLIERVVTVTGPGIQTPKNIIARIGTSFEKAIEFCGGLKDNCEKVISGGPMMGIAQWTTDVPIVKATSGILCLTDAERLKSDVFPCISCGACLRACPINLMPTRIMQSVEMRRWDEVEKFDILDCMECGSCAYDCPSKINLVHYLKWGKAAVMEQKKKNKPAGK